MAAVETKVQDKTIRGISYEISDGFYIFKGLELEEVAYLRRILLSKILVLHTAESITINTNESMLRNEILVKRLGSMQLSGPTAFSLEQQWSIKIENNSVNPMLVHYRDVTFPSGIKCVNNNTILTVLRPKTKLDAFGIIGLSNNENIPGFTKCCDCFFKERDNPDGTSSILFHIESYGQKSVDTLLNEAFALYESKVDA